MTARNDASRAEPALAVDPSRSTPAPSPLSPSPTPPALDGARREKLAALKAKAERVTAINPTATVAVNGSLFLALCAALEAGAALAEGVRHAKRENAILGVHSFRLPELVERFETGATVTETTND